MEIKDYINKTGLRYLWGRLEAIFVKKEDGKGLSTNDFTTAEKQKLESLQKITVDTALNKDSTNPVQNKVIATKLSEITSQGGEPNKIEIIKQNGTALTINTADKSVDIKVPTKVSELTNDSKYLTQVPAEFVTDSELTAKGYATTSAMNTAISTAIANSKHVKKEIVEELPSTGKEDVIYLVPNSKSGNNIYDEYMWINGKFEKTGSSDIDLSGYVQESDLVAITTQEIDQIIGSLA